jgi:transcriptional regulator with XRE-family HTH domain
MSSGKKQCAGFSLRIRDSMRTAGINGPSDFARRLSKRLGRTVNRQTVYKWMTGEVASIRADVMLAVAAEVDCSIIWLSSGEGERQRWRPMDEKRRELSNVYNELSEYAKDELLSYAYRLLRISNPLSTTPVAAPAAAHAPAKTKEKN